MNEITLEAYAKINLGLDVLGRRPNGYHDVKMIMQTIQLHDTITVSAREDDQITMECNIAGLEVDDSNLCVKAAKLIMETCHVDKGVHINLEKRIPIAAGMAGGSTDCAAVLRGMNELYRLGLSNTDLMDLGVKLGADVPYCIVGGTMLSEGIGEELTPVEDMVECNVLVAKPAEGASTKAVYEALDALEDPKHPDIDGLTQALGQHDYAAICSHLGNILEDVTIPMLPKVAEIKKLMKSEGADGVLMSGSGPTVFGLFTSESMMERCAEALKKQGLAEDIIPSRIHSI